MASVRSPASAADFPANAAAVPLSRRKKKQKKNRHLFETSFGKDCTCSPANHGGVRGVSGEGGEGGGAARLAWIHNELISRRHGRAASARRTKR